MAFRIVEPLNMSCIKNYCPCQKYLPANFLYSNQSHYQIWDISLMVNFHPFIIPESFKALGGLAFVLSMGTANQESPLLSDILKKYFKNPQLVLLVGWEHWNN